MAATGGEMNIRRLQQIQSLLAQIRAEHERDIQNIQQRLLLVQHRRNQLLAQGQQQFQQYSQGQVYNPNQSSCGSSSGDRWGNQTYTAASSSPTPNPYQMLGQSQGQGCSYSYPSRPINETYTMGQGQDIIPRPPPPSPSDPSIVSGYYTPPPFTEMPQRPTSAPPAPVATSSPQGPCCCPRHGPNCPGTGNRNQPQIPFSPASPINTSQGNSRQNNNNTTGNSSSLNSGNDSQNQGTGGCGRGHAHRGFQIMHCPICKAKIGLVFELYHLTD